MFDFAWSEMAVIAVVALIAIGPKDMPVALKALAATIKKARRMASEFQTHVDEMMREANLEEVRQSLNEIRNFDVATVVEKHVDPDRSLRDSLSDPLSGTASSTTVSAGGSAEAVSEAGVAEMERPADSMEAEAPREAPGVPAFIPPQIVREAEEAAACNDAPAFVPPSFVSSHV